MDTTFITIHDLTDDANILYCSDSIVDILGHTPDEVVNRSCWQFFHSDEIPLAKQLHSRGVRLDKAAVLAYCRIRNRQQEWISCECCFSIVYDVMVCCTSIYQYGITSQKRAAAAPLVRNLFASSPRDPRYHMLSHLSSKFTLGPQSQTHEPRAALFLNRFTRTLTIMYATSGIEQITGIPSDQMIGRSFYFCIGEECMRDAVDVLERAKGNDSIAYLRFFFRDPRQDDPPPESFEPLSSSGESGDESMTDVTSDDDTEVNVDHDPRASLHEEVSSTTSHATRSTSLNGDSRNSHTSHSASLGADGHSLPTHSESTGDSRPSLRASMAPSSASASSANHTTGPIELEAVVSCTSDGLVVCLRRARPMMPGATLPNDQMPSYNGIFAAPWAHQPRFLPPLPQQPLYPLGAQHPAMAQAAPAGPVQNAFMDCIRDVAVFAWALVGINGSLASYSKGTPAGQSQPPNGVLIWDPSPREKMSATPSGYHSGSSSSNDPYGFGDPGR